MRDNTKSERKHEVTRVKRIAADTISFTGEHHISRNCIHEYGTLAEKIKFMYGIHKKSMPLQRGNKCSCAFC